MKNGWNTKTLEEACRFSNGLWKGEKPPFVNVGVIRNTNFTKEGTLDDSDIAYLDVEAKKFEKRRLRFGDIILEKSGGGPKQAVGRVALFDKQEGDFSFSNFTAALRVLEPDEVDYRYLHKFLYWTYVSGVTEGMQSHSTGIRNLDGDSYKAIKFSFPPLAEQQRIVGLLDEAFAGFATAQANAEKNHQNARALFESHLQSVFTQRSNGWVETTVDKISANLDSKRIPITKNVRSSGEYPYYGASGIVDYVADYIFEGDTLLVSEDGANLVMRSTPIAFSVAGKYWVNNHAHILKFENMATQRFVEFYLESIKLDEYITGAAQPKLNQKALNSIPIPIPKSVDEQAKIVERVESIQEETQRLATLYSRKLAALEAVKKSLLHQAFSGDSSRMLSDDILEIDSAWRLGIEDMGSKPKFWFRHQDTNWLFKQARPNTGEHWAEKISSEIAELLKLSTHEVRIARFEGRIGCAVRSFLNRDEVLVHGNELLAGTVNGYDKNKWRGQADHNFDNIVYAIEKLFPDDKVREILSLRLVGYFVFDALVGNTDRHHENWGMVLKPVVRPADRKESHAPLRFQVKLAPTFDHGSSLGRELLEERQLQLLAHPGAIERYARKAKGGIFADAHSSKGLSPIALVELLAARYPNLVEPWKKRITSLPKDFARPLLASIPAECMSGTSRDFTLAFLAESRKMITSIA